RLRRSVYQTVTLLAGAGLVPVDDIDQLPGVLSELKFELSILIDDQLAGRVENALALFIVGIVQVDFPGRQVVGGAWGVFIGFTEPDPAARGESNPAARFGLGQADVGEVVANRARDRNLADCRRLLERVHQSFVLTLLVSLDKGLFVLLRRVPEDGNLHANGLPQLRAGAHSRGVD